MPREYGRVERLAELIQREIAQLLIQEIRDPRLSLLTVTSVTVSKDMAHAKIFVTQHKDKQDIPETIKLLNKAVGHLRHCLAKTLKLRITPQLRFHYDESLDKSIHLSKLIDMAVAADEEKIKKND